MFKIRFFIENLLAKKSGFRYVHKDQTDYTGLAISGITRLLAFFRKSVPFILVTLGLDPFGFILRELYLKYEIPSTFLIQIPTYLARYLVALILGIEITRIIP